MLYESIENKRIKEIKKLNTKKYRDDANLFLVEGEHLVKEAYKNGLLKTLIVLSNNDFSLDIDTIKVSDNVLKYISSLDTPQPIMGICEKKDQNLVGKRILILENIQDPGNLGTIIRSSVAFNIDTIVLSPNTVDLYNSKVIRASQGMIFNVNIIVRELDSYVRELKNKGYKIVGTSVIGGIDVNSLVKNEKLAIIMGNEGSGLSEQLKTLSDELIYINMNKDCESLNVAVAASIILYELDK